MCYYGIRWANQVLSVQKRDEGGWLQYIYIYMLLRDRRFFKGKHSVVAVSFMAEQRAAPVHVHPPSLHFL